jgi:hypothetical protein
MLRVDTQESELSYQIVKRLTALTRNCKKQTGIYQFSISKSTRSIYVSYLSFVNDTNYKLRISDHRSSVKYGCDANIQTTFEEFNTNYKSILSNLKSIH